MTFVRRRIRNDHHSKTALDAGKAGHFQEARECLSEALRCNDSNADYFWLRGLSLWKLARQHDDPHLYSESLLDLRSSVTLDPTPVLTHDGLWPQSRWALPAYAHLFRKTLSEAGFKSWPTSRAADAIAKIGEVNPESMDSMWAEIEGLLLALATHKTNFYFCPFRKALCAIGWKPSKDGFALVTEEDLLRTGSVTTTPDYWNDNSQVGDVLLDCLSTEEITRFNDACSTLLPKDIAALQRESQSPDRFVRAASCVLLCVRGQPPSVPLMLDELRHRDSHRLSRVAALHSLSKSLEVPHRGDDSQASKALSWLIEAATQDRAAVCRREAVHGLGRIADMLRRLDSRTDCEKCRTAIETALHDKAREVVVAAMKALRRYEKTSTEVIDYIADIHYETRHHFDKARVCWQALGEKSKTVFAMTEPGNSVRRACWDELKTMFCFPHPLVRTAGMEAASFLVGKTEFTGELRSLMLERAWMDDSRDVRNMAKEVLARLG